MRKKPKLVIIGKTIFLLECADGSYFSGMCTDFDKWCRDANEKKFAYFIRHQEKLPLKKILFREDHIPFIEAYAKHRYLRYMTRRHREKLIRTKTWPAGKILKNFLARRYVGIVK